MLTQKTDYAAVPSFNMNPTTSWFKLNNNISQNQHKRSKFSTHPESTPFYRVQDEWTLQRSSCWRNVLILSSHKVSRDILALWPQHPLTEGPSSTANGMDGVGEISCDNVGREHAWLWRPYELGGQEVQWRFWRTEMTGEKTSSRVVDG